jgi:hypothetical protein
MVVVGAQAASRWAVCMPVRFTWVAQKQIDGRFVTTSLVPIRRVVSLILYVADMKRMYSHARH